MFAIWFTKSATAQNEANFREGERVWLSTAVAEAEQEIAARRANLSTEGQRDFDIRQKLNEAQSQLDELTRQQIALMSQDEAPEQLECQPTVLAKAVTGKEVHVLLSDDHVAIVPFDELLEEMKEDITANVWRLKQQDEMERTIGPINGFRLKYCFVKEDVMRQSSAGTYMTGSISRFSHCYFLPVTTPVGEPAAESMKPNSELFQHLKRLRPDGTTITIWTYPGNYDRLRHAEAVDPGGRLSDRRPAAAQGNAPRRFAAWQRVAQRVAGESPVCVSYPFDFVT